MEIVSIIGLVRVEVVDGSIGDRVEDAGGRVEGVGEIGGRDEKEHGIVIGCKVSFNKWKVWSEKECICENISILIGYSTFDTRPVILYISEFVVPANVSISPVL